jgi:hypothetical protein
VCCVYVLCVAYYALSVYVLCVVCWVVLRFVHVLCDVHCVCVVCCVLCPYLHECGLDRCQCAVRRIVPIFPGVKNEERYDKQTDQRILVLRLYEHVIEKK